MRTFRTKRADAGCHGSEREEFGWGFGAFEAVEEVAWPASYAGRRGLETRMMLDQVNSIAQYVWTDLAGC